MPLAQESSAGNRFSIVVQPAVPAAISHGRRAAVLPLRASLPEDPVQSIRRAPRWVLAAPEAQADPERGLALARDPDLAGHRAPDLAHGQAVQAAQPQREKHLARSAHLRAAAADARSTPRPKKAR